jgi:hypothetical protein
MKSLHAVRPAMPPDVKKLQADFIHGYRSGAAVFYVSLTNEYGEHIEVTEKERALWDDHWKTRNEEFEDYLLSDPELSFLSNKMFWVWDGNHRLNAWLDHIAMIHESDLDWHYRVRSILLDTSKSVTDALTSMHDINKATENAHVRNNLVHVLHRMKKVGNLPLESFKDILTFEEIEQMKLDLAKPEKKTWYPLPRAKFLEYLYSVRISPSITFYFSNSLEIFLESSAHAD